MKKLVIDESKWLRGAEAYDGDINASALLRERDGKMCCLGFLGLELGCSRNEILNQGELSEVLERDRAMDLGLVTARESSDEDGNYYASTSNALESEIIEVNDDRDMPDQVRKSRLVPLFQRIGWELEFVPGDGK